MRCVTPKAGGSYLVTLSPPSHQACPLPQAWDRLNDPPTPIDCSHDMFRLSPPEIEAELRKGTDPGIGSKATAANNLTSLQKDGLGLVPSAPPPHGAEIFEQDLMSTQGCSRSWCVDSESEEEIEIPCISPQGDLHQPVRGVWCAGLTQCGLYPDQDHDNQDRVAVHLDCQGSGSHLLSVLDGHGPEGHHVAEFVCNALPTMLENRLLPGQRSPQAVPEQMQVAYEEVDEALARCPEDSIDSRFSGTTAVSCWITGKQLWVANTGDSRAVLGRVNSAGKMVAHDLSSDQTPFRQDEKARVERSGARVLTSGEIHGEAVYASTEGYTADDPPRCYLWDQKFPGTAFTRSIGDQVGKSIGVIAAPEVQMHEVEAEDRILILASDGIWEFISSQAAMEIVEACNDPHEAAHKLIDAAWEIWLTEDVRSDDISVVVVFLDAGQMANPN
jgi:serine/threonine protein phosphatase PrpC